MPPVAARVAEYGEFTFPSGNDVVVTPLPLPVPPEELVPPQAANCRQQARTQITDNHSEARFIVDGFLKRMAGAGFDIANVNLQTLKL